MAYGVKYQIKWNTSENAGYINIYENNYVGTIDYSLRINVLRISRPFEDWQQHIIGATCEFDIINNKSNYFELFDLLIATEKKYKIVVGKYAPSPYILFEGYVNTEANEQRYLHYSSIRIVASSYISKLENVYPEEIETIEPLTFIDIIQACLTETGSALPIHAYSWLISEHTGYSVLKSFLNQNGVTSEIFWENNIDRFDSNKILESILRAFQCYMYYWNEGWYIESFDRLFTESKNYVKYLAGQSYLPTDEGTQLTVVFPVRDLHELQFIEMSQTVRTIPGNRTVQVRINTKPYYNLTINDFKNIVRIADLHPQPPLREWRCYQPMTQTYMVWNAQDAELPYKRMINAIKRTSTFTNTGAYSGTPDYNPNAYNALGYLWNGLSTSVRLTNAEFTDTTLDISWKYSQGDLRDVSVLNAAEVSNYNTHWHYRKIKILFQYYIQIYDLDTGIWFGTLYYDDEFSRWAATDRRSLARTTPNGIIGSYVTVEESEFDRNHICEVNITIPLKTVQVSTEYLPLGNYKFTLVICTERVRWYKDSAPFMSPKRYDRIATHPVYYGDIRVSAPASELETDIVEGRANTDFIDKMEVETDIADMPNWNYKNAALEGETLNRLTEYWYRNEAQQRKLVDYILIDKFRTGDVTRQRIIAKVKTADILRPFSRFTESKQDGKQFLLTSIIHDVLHDEYELALDEYDNTTVINLIG